MEEKTLTSWLYKGKFLAEEDVPPKALGFVYLMTQISTGKRYIGRKLLTSSSRKSVKGKVKKTRVKSDWVDYYSSSPWIKEFIEEHGKEDFTREILVFVSSKGMLVYAEEFVLFSVGALESDEWLNQNIRSKIFSNWVKRDEAKELRQAVAHLVP